MAYTLTISVPNKKYMEILHFLERNNSDVNSSDINSFLRKIFFEAIENKLKEGEV